MSNAQFIASLLTAVDSDNQAKQDKGETLKQAHAIMDKASGAQLAVIDQAIAAMRPEGNKDKRIERAYKLGKRYTAVAAFLMKHGLTFAAIGQPISGKKTVSLNLVESIRSALNDGESIYHQAAQTFTTSKDFAAWLVDTGRADTAASEAAKASDSERFKAQGAALADEIAKREALEAELAALKAAGKRARKTA